MSAPRVLVVDDEPDVEALITQKFRRKVRNGEIEFIFAQDGQHALEVLVQNPDVDVVLSDINMPRMDGLTLLERLNELHGDLETVIVSAYGDMRNIRTAMNRGAFDFITKPIEFDDLEMTLAKTLSHRLRIRELQQSRDEAERARTTLSRYFSPSVVEALASDTEHLETSGTRRDATFLFTDLANFTPLVEASSSEVIVRILNAYLDGVIEAVFTHSGTVMKIIGDAVQATFGAPLDDPDHATHAVECALAIDAFAEGFRAQLAAEGIELGATRIGVNSGAAIIGNFGGKRFLRLHGLRRRREHRRAAGIRQQGDRDAHLRQRKRRRPDRRLQRGGPSARCSSRARTRRSAASNPCPATAQPIRLSPSTATPSRCSRRTTRRRNRLSPR